MLNIFDPSNETITGFLATFFFLAVSVVACVALGMSKGRSRLFCGSLGLIPILGPAYVLSLENRAGVHPSSHRRIFFFLALAYLVGPLIAGLSIGVWRHAASHIRRSAFAPIITRVSPTVDQCKTVETREIAVRGRVLVWDLTTCDLASIHDYLPPEFKARPKDREMTIFFLGARREINTGMIYISKDDRKTFGGVASAAAVDVYTVYWPSATTVGKFTVFQNAPKEVTLKPGSLPWVPDIAMDQLDNATWSTIYGLVSQAETR